MVIDARGVSCPKPVLMAEDALNGMLEGIVEVWVDNEASVANLKRFASNNGMMPETFAENGYWRVKITKGYPCDIPAGAESLSLLKKKKDILLIVGTDTIGRDEVLGRILIKGIFETMKVTKELPHTIFFLNTAVRLTTTDDEMIPIFREFTDRGVEIFTCGTCLKHFDLERDLKVGYRGTTNHIVEGMKDFEKTVWIG
ncbi:MAG TPA: sulfurtransferase-like selenium metabolism protein YedF [Dissulfurispiraceae bacterium]|nr:sulfurtransferase-like selenium metabolism protein YedF [Dissulfurispiraceae bacterium]